MGGEKFFAKTLTGKTVNYRIPVGSDSFRASVREQIEKTVTGAGGKVNEVSYFLKSDIEPDLELEFVATSNEEEKSGLAELLAIHSSRLGAAAGGVPHLIGEVVRFPLTIMVKGDLGDIYSKTFLEPDLAEKQMGI